MNYQEAGVDVNRADKFIKQIQELTKKTEKRPETILSSNGYGACFTIPQGYKNPVIVTTTDGVGTKIKLALQAEDTEKALFNIGIDVVAMCVNDLICEGAEPIHFLDYYATSLLDVEQATFLMKGIVHGCEIAGCQLVGGETAEMPGMYNSDDFDVAGFAVGIVENDLRFTKDDVKSGDVLIGLPSNGIHSNGFSLIRKILEDSDISLQDEFVSGEILEEELLKPTTIYVKPVLDCLRKYKKLIKGIAHITGGGFYGNIPRILPDNIQARIIPDVLNSSSIFYWIKEESEISIQELYETFNCGIGLVLIVDADWSDKILQEFPNSKIIGYLKTKSETDSRSLDIHYG